MRIDISLLPALAAAFMLVFARIGAMVMLLPGLGEANIPVRIKLAIARSEERRVGKECRSVCRSRWSPYH